MSVTDKERAALIAALEVAVNAPTKQHKHSSEARVRWQLIHRLRDAFDDLGIDWREVKAKQDAIDRERMEARG